MNSDKDYDKWYVLTDRIDMAPIRIYSGDASIFIQELVEAGDQDVAVIDEYIESLRVNMQSGWANAKERMVEYEGDVQVVDGAVVLGGTK